MLEDSEYFEYIEIGCKKNSFYLKLLDVGERAVELFMTIYNEAYELSKKWTDQEKGMEMPLHRYPLFFEEHLLEAKDAQAPQNGDPTKFFWWEPESDLSIP